MSERPEPLEGIVNGLHHIAVVVRSIAEARGAWEAGVRVATAYPRTPATEINQWLATYAEIDAEWSVNEKVALEVGIPVRRGMPWKKFPFPSLNQR